MGTSEDWMRRCVGFASVFGVRHIWKRDYWLLMVSGNVAGNLSRQCCGER